MKLLSILLLILCTSAESEQKFVYLSNETVTIEANSICQVSLSLTTGSDQYLSQATIQTVLVVNQNQTPSINYNIVYFNYENLAGQECYQDWIINNTQLNITNCSSFSNLQGNLPNCMNFTNCINETISFPLHLSQQLYKQSLIMIQNPNNSTQLVLETQVKMELSSYNTWFYWGVGLTCLLLISLVIYAGIIFYWMLKYKKIKKMFQQFKLTEEQESIKKDN